MEFDNALAGRRKATSADEKLAVMGYKAELPRTLSMFSILGLSFAIMAVPFGLSTTMTIGLTDGGPVTILYGWIFVSLISTGISASLGEICSAFPTSGGVYYWSAMLSPRRYAALASYITGWIGLIGNLLVSTSISFSGGQLILSAIGLWNENFAPKPWHVVLTYFAVLIVALAANLFPSRMLDKLNTACVYWTGVSVAVILVTVLSKAENGRRSAKFVFSEYDTTRAGWAPGWTFFVGLLQAAYTLTGYGMVASLCEEVQNPEREVPRAMLLSVVAAGMTGIVYLIPILFVMPNVDDVLRVQTGQPIGYIYKLATGSSGGGFGLLFLILGILAFASIGSLTAVSRNLYAFSRDGGVPLHRYWSCVNTRLDQPLNALLLCTLIEALLGLIYLGSSAAFNSFTGAGTLCLSASYGAPILVSLATGRRLVNRHASFRLGHILGRIINGVTIAWIGLAVVLFCMPTALPVDKSSMNYASVLFVGFGTIAGLFYAVVARKTFTGPPTRLDASEVPENSHESIVLTASRSHKSAGVHTGEELGDQPQG
ncbi:hypothetical protein PYCC9005_000731 [Savitreella phatthalungensis]